MKANGRPTKTFGPVYWIVVARKERQVETTLLEYRYEVLSTLRPTEEESLSPVTPKTQKLVGHLRGFDAFANQVKIERRGQPHGGINDRVITRVDAQPGHEGLIDL